MKQRKVKGWDLWLPFKEREIIRSEDARRLGISPAFIATDAQVGFLRKLAPGVYVHVRDKLTYDRRLRVLVEKYPCAVPCLTTALWLQGIGISEPEHVWAALPTGSHIPRASGLDARFVELAREHCHSGLTECTLDGVRVSSAQVVRAVAECFKFRRHVGIVTAVDAMYSALGRFDFHPDELIEWAKRLRVERLVRSHLAVWARRDDPHDDEDDGGPAPYTNEEPFPPMRRPGRPPHRRDLLPVVGELAYRNGTLPEQIARRAILPGTKERKRIWEEIRAWTDRDAPD